MSEASATTQEKDIPWEIAVLFFFLGWISTYADRMILNPLPILIRSEFVLTNARVGLISGLFVLTQPLLQMARPR